jgi:hypothetical protein
MEQTIVEQTIDKIDMSQYEPIDIHSLNHIPEINSVDIKPGKIYMLSYGSGTTTLDVVCLNPEYTIQGYTIPGYTIPGYTIPERYIISNDKLVKASEERIPDKQSQETQMKEHIIPASVVNINKTGNIGKNPMQIENSTKLYEYQLKPEVNKHAGGGERKRKTKHAAKPARKNRRKSHRR